MSDDLDQHDCLIGVLDFKRFHEVVEPAAMKILASRDKNNEPALEELRVFVANVKERERRDEASSQLDRIAQAVQSNRWHQSAAGKLIDYACCEDLKPIPNFFESVPLWIDILYDWDVNNARAIHQFFNFLSEHTIIWASPQDRWRAAIGPDDLEDATAAMAALTERQFAKLLSDAENGDIFEAEEAKELGTWWNELRSTVRLARRMEAGLLVIAKE